MHVSDHFLTVPKTSKFAHMQLYSYGRYGRYCCGEMKGTWGAGIWLLYIAVGTDPTPPPPIPVKGTAP